MKVSMKLFYISSILSNYENSKTTINKVYTLKSEYKKALEAVKKEKSNISNKKLTELIIRIVVAMFNAPKNYRNNLTFYPSWIEQSIETSIDRADDGDYYYASLSVNLVPRSYVYSQLMKEIQSDDTINIQEYNLKLLKRYKIIDSPKGSPKHSTKSSPKRSKSSPKGFKFYCHQRTKQELINEALRKKLIKNKSQGLKMKKDQLCKLLGISTEKPKASGKSSSKENTKKCNDYSKDELINLVNKKTKEEICKFLKIPIPKKHKSPPKKRKSPPRKHKSPPKKRKSPKKPKSIRCPELMKKLDIYNKKQFRKWAVKGGHPDKGGAKSLFQQVNNCVEGGIYAN